MNNGLALRGEIVCPKNELKRQSLAFAMMVVAAALAPVHAALTAGSDSRRRPMVDFGNVVDQRAKFITDPVISFVYGGRHSAQVCWPWVATYWQQSGLDMD